MGGRCCGFESCGFRVGRWNADRTDGFANADDADFFLQSRYLSGARTQRLERG